MKELLLINGHFQLQDVEEPQISSDHEVKVRIAYSAICGFDVEAFKGVISLRSKRGEIGHEVSGYVVQVGKKVTRLKVGMQVSVNPLQPCMNCTQCRQGRYSYCERGVDQYSTLMQEYIVADESRIFEIDKSVTLSAAALTETVASAMHIAQRSKFELGGSLIIFGCGGLGATLLSIAKRYPLTKVVVVEPVKEKRDLARKLGADAVWDPNSEDILEKTMQFTNNECFDRVVEASGNKMAANLAPHVVSRGGKLVYAGLYDTMFCVEMSLFELYWKDVDIHGIFVAPWNIFYQAVQLLPSLPLEEIISGIRPIEQAELAFEEKSAGLHAKLLLDWHATAPE